jgi:Predicted signal transduction protein with a C-terminal ATPase domain
MNNIGIKWNKSIFSRLTATFLFALIPIYILGTSIYSGGRVAIREELSKSMTSQVKYYMDNFEKDIERAGILLYALINDNDLNRLASAYEAMDTAEATAAINRVREKLKSIKDINIYIKDTRVHILSLEKTISAINSLEKIQIDEYDELKKLHSISNSKIIYWQGRLFFCYLYPVYSGDISRKPLYMFVMELDNNELEDALGQFNNYEDGSALLFSLDSDYTAESGGLDTSTINNLRGLTQAKIKVKETGTFVTENNGKQYIAIYSKSEYFDLAMAWYIPLNEFYKPLFKYQIWFLIFSFVSLLIVFAYSFSTLKVIHRPLTNLVSSFKKVENGDLNEKVLYRRDDEFGYLYTHFNTMVENLKVLIEQVYKQKIMTQHAELKQLQLQINPHFLYNSLFALKSMILKGDYEKAEQFVDNLANYFKYITRNAADDIMLKEETEYAGIYSQIQETRFRNRIRVEFGEIPENCKSFIVPRLIMQPIIENAFKHGLKDKLSEGLIRVEFHETSDKLCIFIEDNGNGIDETGLEMLAKKLNNEGNDIECTGLINIHRRIRMKYGPESGLSISQGEFGGLRVEMRISFIKDDKIV